MSFTYIGWIVAFIHHNIFARAIRLYFATLVGMGIASVVGYLQMGLSLAVLILVLTIVSAWIYVSVPLLRKDVRLNYDWAVLLRRVSPLLLGIQMVPLVCMLLV